MSTAVVPGPGAPQPSPQPARPGRRRLWLLLSTLVFVLLVGCCGVAGFAVLPKLRHPVGAAAGQSPDARDRAVQQLLDRRAGAVLAKDERAFLADVAGPETSGEQSPLRAAQQQEYDNLTKLPLAQLSYRLETAHTFDRAVPRAVRDRFAGRVYAPGVTVRYSIKGIDAAPVAVPWTPVFGFDGHRWLLGGLVKESGTELVVGGQPWSGEPIAVTTSDRVVLVRSAADPEPPDNLMRLAEASLDRVLAVRPSGWAGKVLVLAVQDPRVFDAYFQDSKDQLMDVAAIAVRQETEVAQWHGDGKFAATLVVFNPDEIRAVRDQLREDLVHEFTHAAMAPVTGRDTPLWLAEGFAEYVAYKGGKLSAAEIRRRLNGVSVSGDIPSDYNFYSNAGNYAAAWLACRMIAERYGEAKLIELYSEFTAAGHSSRPIDVVPRVLGVSLATLTTDWNAYAAKALR